MPRPEKVQAVAEIKERLERAQAVFLAEYAGLSVKQQQTLRRGLRESGAEFKVVKMSLARRAAAELKLADLDELFLGPTGIAFADGDPVPAAKALKDFAKENDAFAIKGGLLGAEFLSPERISDLADIESREVLLAKIAGAMKAPMANLAGLLAAMPRNLASAMQQLVDKKEEAAAASGAGGGEPPAADAVSDESTEEEPAETTEEEVTGEAVAETAPEIEVEEVPETSDEAPADAEVEEVPESSDEAPADAEVEEVPETSDEAPAEEDSSKADGDDAESVDEDQATAAEEA